MMSKQDTFNELYDRLDALLEGETDAISMMATIACEWHHAVDYSDWTGFYRVVADGVLKIGPYQGGHGCLVIPFERGICGQAAREKTLLNIPDVSKAPAHIACSSSTRSELVAPIIDAHGDLIAIFDCDSDSLAAFDTDDEAATKRIAGYFRR